MTRSGWRRAIRVLIFTPAFVPAAQAATTAGDWALCGRQTARLERVHRIADHLLTAISLVEAGRADRGTGRTVAWPWTIMAEGRSRYPPTKAAAIGEVERLRARGVKNIDVGCMQVNLYWHGDAFENLAEAFDPRHNVDYAARFLASHYRGHGSWNRAVARYHSVTPRFNVPYVKKVLAAWRQRRAEASQPADRGNSGVAVVAADGPGRPMPTMSRRGRVEANTPNQMAWRQARPGGFRRSQVILRQNSRHVVLKPGRNWAGRGTRAAGRAAPGSISPASEGATPKITRYRPGTRGRRIFQ